MKNATILKFIFVCFCATVSFKSLATIHFVKFSVEQKNQSAILDWISAEEKEIESFNIEKSLDGKFWFEISSVTPRKDSSIYYHNSYTDSNLAEGIQYYRIKIVDANGNGESSEIQSFKLEKEIYLEPELFPNPSNGVFVLKYTFQSSEQPTFNIVTSRGKIVDIAPINSSGMYTFDISDFYQGVYFLQIIEGEKLIRTKISKK